jgi:hypothetical protein
MTRSFPQENLEMLPLPPPNHNPNRNPNRDLSFPAKPASFGFDAQSPRWDTCRFNVDLYGSKHEYKSPIHPVNPVNPVEKSCLGRGQNISQ